MIRTQFVIALTFNGHMFFLVDPYSDTPLKTWSQYLSHGHRFLSEPTELAHKFGAICWKIGD